VTKPLRTLVGTVLLVASLLLAGQVSTALATGGRLCDGYAQCSTGGYTTHGYQNHSSTSYWGMEAGDECTNYAAFVESTVYGVATPGYRLGNGGEWATSAAAHGVEVNGTPTVGSVAEWNAGDYGMGEFGHVAIVEAVDSGYIEVSQQNIVTDTNGYDWERINDGSPSNEWEPWPDHFIHFKGTSGGGPPAEGEFVSYEGHVYRIAGGAPLYVSSWSSFGGPQPTRALSSSEWSALKPVPANGTFVVSSTNGRVYEIAGGAPLYVSSWEHVGGEHAYVVVDQWDFENITNPWAHMNAVPSNGTLIVSSADGRVYEIAGGAPLFVSSWEHIGGERAYVRVDQWDLENIGSPYAHLNVVPSDGTLIVASGDGRVYEIAGGAPLYVSSWEHIGGERAYVVVDEWDLENIGSPYAHLNAVPSNGTLIVSSSDGRVYEIAGGAPLFVSNWEAIGGERAYVVVDEWDLENIASPYAHLNAVPSNGTFVNARDAAGEERGAYVIAGGAPIWVSTWEVFGGEPASLVSIDAWDIENDSNPYAHLNPSPTEGTVVDALPAESFWVFKDGTRRHTGTTADATAVDEAGLASFARAMPSVSSPASSTVSPVSEFLSASVDPEGEPVTECRFEYGTTDAYGASVPCSSLPGEGEGAIPVSATAAGLRPGTEYHYRVVAVGPGGASESTDATFTTAAFGVTTESLPEGTVYTKANKKSYAATLTAAGGKPPYKWSLTTGSKLPPGLKLASSGKISGKATTAGTYTFTVQVVDTKTKTKPPTQNKATAMLSITINPA